MLIVSEAQVTISSHLEVFKIKNAEGETTGMLTSRNSAEEKHFPVVFDYQGSILSQLRKDQITPPLAAVKEQMLSIKSLDLLSPDALRKRSRISDKDLGLGGEKTLSFFV